LSIYDNELAADNWTAFFADPILQYLFTSLQHCQLATAAAESLQAVCSQCPDQMTSHFGALLQIIQAIDSFDVTNDAAIGLLKGIPNHETVLCWELFFTLKVAQWKIGSILMH